MSARILVVDDSTTIRKVVATILSTRSFEPVLAADGQEALDLLESEHIDLVLLDFVMPRMNGYQFCRELRAHPVHKALPVVLMSAKGDKIRGQFVQQTGAIDAITKPFDARGLIAVIEGALKKQEEGRQRPVPDAGAMPDEEISEPERPSRAFNSDPGIVREQGAREFTAALEHALLPELELSLPNLSKERFREALGRAMQPDTLRTLSSLMLGVDSGTGTRDVLSGDISVISIAEVLQLLDLQRQSGALRMFKRKEEITLYIRKGNLDWATSNGLSEEYLVGRYLIGAGILTREGLAQALEAQERSGDVLLGESLVRLGLASEEQVERALIRQASELLYEVVRWKSGRFSFSVGTDQPIATKAELDLETGSLVMEGFRRVDEWRMIEGSFDFDEVLFPDPVAIERLGGDSSLTFQERAVLEAIDGERSIREIVGNMGGSSFDLCKIVYQFLNSRLVRRKAA
jgi:DNA-binding response OmpR family regulator